MIQRHLLAAALGASLLAGPTAGCGGDADKPKPKPAADAPTKTAAKADATAKAEVAQAPASPVKNVVEFSKKPLDSPKSIEKAVEAADDLVKWAGENPDHPEAQAAKLWSAWLRLMAVGSSAGLHTGPAARALGGDGAQSRQLRQALGVVEEAEKGDWKAEGLDTGRLATAVRALLGADPDEKDVRLEHDPSMKLALSGTPEGEAVRAVWLERFEKALEALKSGDVEDRFRSFSRHAGRILCPSCSDAHHVAPDRVTRFLLNKKKNMGGAVCDAAFAGEIEKEPIKQLERMASCKDALDVAEGAEPAIFWGPNFVVLALLDAAHDLTAAEVAKTPLEAAVNSRKEAVAALIAKPVIMPDPMPIETLPDSGERAADATLPAMVTGLGFRGLAVDKEALDTFVVGPQAVRVGMRPVVAVQDGKIVSLSSKAGWPGGGEAAIAIAELEEAKVDAKTKGVQAIVDKADRLATAVDKLAETLDPKPSKGDDRGRVAEVVVDALAPAWAVEKTLDSLKAAGYGHFRFRKTEQHGRTLPLLVRSAPEGVGEALGVGYERPIIAEVTGDHVDVWAPDKKKEGVKLNTKEDEKLPEGAEPGYRGRELVRLRVPIPEGMGYGLDSETTRTVQKAMLYFLETSGAGPLVHVVAGEKARGADVLRVARTIQERRSEGKVDKPADVWADTKCEKDDLTANRRFAQGCPTGVAVAFSSASVPSSRGVSSSPRTASKAPRKDKPEPEKPKAGFCAKRDIAVAMRKRKSAFRFCYERELRLNNNLKGRVVLRFTIGTSGSVTSASIASSSLKNKSVHDCLVKNVKKIRFTKPEGGTCDIRWPFKFDPS